MHFPKIPKGWNDIPDKVQMGQDEEGNPVVIEPKTMLRDGIIFAVIGIGVKKVVNHIEENYLDD